MTESEEQAYLRGSDMAWIRVLGMALRELGYHHPEARKAAWVKERAETVGRLRGLCAEFGDTDWPDDLYIPDILDRHLACHLEDLQDKAEEENP